jgi:hypothetical protein
MRWTNLNDFVTGELEAWDMHRIAGHEIAVEDSKNRLMGNDEEIILFSFEFEDDRLKTDGEIMIGL